MAKKITELPAITAATGALLLLGVDSTDGVSKKITKADIGILTPTTIQTGAATASNGDLVLYDPSGGTFQIDAPLTPEAGDLFAIKNTTIDVTSVTIDGNGNNIEDPATASFVTDFALAVKLVTISYLFDGTNWIVI